MIKIKYIQIIIRFAVFAGLSIHNFACAAKSERDCMPLPSSLKVDQVWGGTTLRFSAVESDVAIYIGYYDVDRWLTVSQIDKCTGLVRRVRLNSRFEGWDSHNYVTLALDNEGRLHVAGNMHVSPMVYSKMSAADNLESLKNIQRTTGSNQDNTTYPVFFKFLDGALGMSYRFGHSGDGIEIIDRFEGNRWQRWLDRPLFAPTDGRQPVNAYPTEFVKGTDGYFHVAWVWRTNYGVEYNRNVNYARSKDLRHWQNSRGETLSLPITPANAEIVDPVPEMQGLLNNIRLGFDVDGKPVISYLKFDETGASQLFHARSEKDGWNIKQSTQWSYRWDPRGGGSIQGKITFGGVVSRDGKMVERVAQPEVGNVTLSYDISSLSVAEVLKNYRWPDAFDVKRSAIPGTRLTTVAVRPIDGVALPKYAFSWLGMPPDSRDLPRPCRPEIIDCRYAFDLILHRLDAR